MSGLDPGGATTPAEYVALLRRLKDSSGLTYRQLERRAEDLGEVLPRSTVASMLARDTLPRVELVSALLKVCGETDDAAWLRAYVRVSSAPAPSAEKPRRRWAWPVGVAVAVLIVIAVAVLSAQRSDDEPHPITARPNPAAPAEGSYRIRAVHSGLCFSEREGTDSGVVYQKNCAQTLPRYSLDRLEDGSYRVRADHPQFGPGCLGVRKASMSFGGTVVDDECDTGGAELFNLESVGTSGFRLRALHSNLCVGISDGERDEWVTVRQVACESPLSATVLAFDPVR
ncbi:hypothetical protein NLX83_12175 [Allokutzneria sp. A3M-2-11 16]|uniref:helix-turn-helix domain-containing protein n=1 Tax=Allokutzneria sp. A3M-2-11 16 TaxID=2962043 RepID=UPI0020B6ACA9|nr:helix-turn-helix domain-containing protein [Allokutzneria sp. A3M-2-11 16]MCP3800013.1 hypothetical protein [Allokutzneria sp. A3M-2-11 16]